MNQYFHFTLGPVQGFVAQARRTRDFWSGSFLLSWLSAVAIQEVIRQTKNKDAIQFPTPNKNYLLHLTGEKTDAPPEQGCIPNRFKAKIDTTSFDPHLVSSAVQQAWKGLAEHIWNQDGLTQLDKNGNSKTVWDNQIKSFWEMTWCLTADEADSSALDRRKNWRTHYPPSQAGVKCMMMDGWQEISAAQRPNDSTLTTFWESLRKGRKAIKTDLREQEHLCAIGYVKRRFSRYFEGLSIEIKDPQEKILWKAHGWKVPTGVPSVAYLAATPWISQMLKTCAEEKIQEFHKNAFLLTEEYAECDSQIRCIEEALEQTNASLEGWKALDGNLYFDAALENKKLWDETRLAYLKPTHDALKAIRKATELEPVSPFYAVLLMDGDSLGKQMGSLDNQKIISKALNSFTDKVPDIVQQHSGFLIYAGGDDVLAILPLEFALQCALAIRRCYQHCFEGSHITTSISAAIIYAHIKTPLGRVLAESHTVLDHIAKDYHGRDSLAVRVLKPGGEHLQWGMPWDKAISPHDNNLIIDNMVNAFRQQEQHTPFASRFFYRIREHYQLLAPRKKSNTEMTDEVKQQPAIDIKYAIDLLASEYINSGATQQHSGKKPTIQEARETISELLSQCITWKRVTDGINGTPLTETQWLSSALPKADGALLLHFLAKKGIES